MHVQLDEEVWEMADSARLEEVLARISDRAHANARLVTHLMVGERSFTDRDLLPTVLSQPAGVFGKVVAKSQRIQAVLQDGEPIAKKFAGSLQSKGKYLVRSLRAGETPFRQIDEWFGQLADFVEWAELAHSSRLPHSSEESLTGWINQVLEARNHTDTVRLADILEYEVLPRLPVAPSYA
jgi:hypothetical protein